MHRRSRIAATILFLACFAAAAQPGAYDWHLPPGITPPPVPADNPMSAVKVELGRRLFYDPALSLDSTMSCATCHEQARAFSDGKATHPGIRATPGLRNVMGLANAAYFDPLTWADTNEHVLEHQALLPLMGEHPIEMGAQDKEMVRRLEADSCYRALFAQSFPEVSGRIEVATLTKALGAFQRTLLSFDSPHDHFRRGDKNALSAAALRGAALFTDTLHCTNCHAGDNFTDGKFHNIGLYNLDGKGGYPEGDHGLRDITGLAKDEGAIRTPPLRNVALTGPYMHDGSVKSLSDAVRRHLAPNTNPLRDTALRSMPLTPQEEADLIAFLESLSDSGFVNNPAFASPKMACGKPL